MSAQSSTDVLDRGQIIEVSIDSIYPSPENDKIYRPVAQDDPEIAALGTVPKQNPYFQDLSIIA